MADTETIEQKSPFWAPDTRTIIVCWMMVSSFVLVVLCWWRPPPADNQIVTMLVSVYVSTGFVTALQWWMGSAKGTDANNNMAAANSKMVDKITTAVVQQIPQTPAVVVAWWSKLVNGEAAAIIAAAAADPKVQAFIDAAKAGRAAPDDLAYLVSKNLLTQDRATAIQSA